VTIWKIFPNDPKKKSTFTLLSSNNHDKGLSLIYFGENNFSENIQKEIENIIQQNKPNKNIEKNFKEYIYNDRLINNMTFLPIKNANEEEIISSFSEIMELKKNDSGKILILFEEENLAGLIKKLFDKFFKDPFFIIIFTKRKENEIKKEIKNKLKNFSNLKKPYIDIDNIYIYENKSENYKKILIPILKIFSYYNQLGDGFFKEILDMNLQIEGLHEEFSHLFLSHYFNILLCGGTGVGKSTFINKIMGEKKAFTLKSISAATYRNNYYCHKKYPIKIIDVCGFAEGNEGKDNLESIRSIYNKNLDNIIIDQSISDIFDFYEDKRNNIHLLLYFNIYDGKLDVIPGELPVILEAIEKKIPIFFILNKCPDEVFEEDNEELIKDLQGIINHARENTLYSDFKTYFINCLNLKGFDKLLKAINEQF
jgi:GTP-binding protein EngB required for normal cell division